MLTRRSLFKLLMIEPAPLMTVTARGQVRQSRYPIQNVGNDFDGGRCIYSCGP